MKVEGKLEAEGLSSVLRRIEAERGTGILTLQGDDDIIGVTFLGGEILSADAVNQSPEETVGRLLVERGVVSREAFAAMLAEQNAGSRLQDFLLERGVVGQSELAELLREKSLRLCTQALGWRRGRFRFYPNDEITFEPGLEPIAVGELLDAQAAGPAALAGGDGDAGREAAAAAERLGLADDEALARQRDAWIYTVGRSLERPAAPTRLGWLLAAAALAALAALWVVAPTRLLFPLSAQGVADAAFRRQQQSSLYLEVDRAAKAYYLLEGSFPRSLGDLVQGGFLTAGDLDASGRRELAYADAPASYLVLVGSGEQEGEREVRRSHRTETVAGHFLLDPDFVAPEVVDVPALVLLD